MTFPGLELHDSNVANGPLKYSDQFPIAIVEKLLNTLGQVGLYQSTFSSKIVFNCAHAKQPTITYFYYLA